MNRPASFLPPRSDRAPTYSPSDPASGRKSENYESVIDRALLFLVIILVPTIPFSQFRVPTHSFLLPYVAAALAMLAYWALISFKSPVTPSRTSKRCAAIIMLFGAWAMLSLSWSQPPQFAHLISLMFYVLAAAVIAARTRVSGTTLQRSSTLLMVLLTILTIYGLYLLASHQTYWFQFTSANSTQIGTRNADAFMIATAFPLALARATTSGASKRIRLMAASCGALYIAAIMLSLSRSSTVGIAIAGIVIITVGRDLIPVRARTLVALAIPALVAIFILHSYFGGQELSLTRLQTVDQSSRIPLAQMAYHVGMAHPLGGVGYYGFPAVNAWDEDAHDAYLNLFAELGIPGLLVFILLFAVPLYRYLTLARQLRDNYLEVQARVLYLQGFGMLLTLALLSLTDTFYKSIYFWIIYILSVMHLAWLECIPGLRRVPSETARIPIA